MVRLLDRGRESRPQAHHLEPAHSIPPASKIESSLAARPDVLTDLDDLAAVVDGTFVVVVKVTGGKYRRRCYLTAASAERAAARATERGENATVYMAQLKPLWKILGGGR